MGVSLEISPESLLLLKLAKAVKDLKARQPEKGEPGRDPTADEIQTAVSLWMEFHREDVRGEPGRSPKAVPGPAGVGIDDVDVDGSDLVIVLTDGRKKRFKLPTAKPKQYPSMLIGAGGSGGLSADQVEQMINDALEDALAGPIEVKNDSGDQLRADSGEVEYFPGPTPLAIAPGDGAGDHLVYTAPADKAFRIRRSKVAPILRGLEESPQITVKILDADDVEVDRPFIDGYISVRQLITCPVGGKIVVNLDIASRVAGGFTIEEFTP